jgi:hypothetical protein
MANSISLVKDDSELTSEEVVSLLGRELKVAGELERKLVEQKVHWMTHKVEQFKNSFKEEKLCCSV